MPREHIDPELEAIARDWATWMFQSGYSKSEYNSYTGALAEAAYAKWASRRSGDNIFLEKFHENMKCARLRGSLGYLVDSYVFNSRAESLSIKCSATYSNLFVPKRQLHDELTYLHGRVEFRPRRQPFVDLLGWASGDLVKSAGEFVRAGERGFKESGWLLNEAFLNSNLASMP